MKNQKIEILPARREDIDKIVELFRDYRFALQEREWYEWKYFRTPYEVKAASYKIIKDGKIVGAVALLPRNFYFRGRCVWGIQAVDGLMGREIRGKGLFNEVMTFLRNNLPQSITDNYFYISFPSLPESVKAHQNAGWQRIGDFELYSYFYNLNILHKKEKLFWLARLLHPIWKLRNLYYLPRKIATMEFTEILEYDEDLNTFFKDSSVFGDRSAAFMNWRTIHNPKDKIRSFWVKESGERVGFIVCKVLNRNWEIMDVKFRYFREKYLKSFLKYIQLENLADSVDFGIFSNHPYRKYLRKCGFLSRKIHGALFVHDIHKANLPTDTDLWEINYIDSDW